MRRHPMSAGRSGAALMCGVALTFVACGGDDDGAASISAAPITTPQITTSPIDASAPSTIPRSTSLPASSTAPTTQAPTTQAPTASSSPTISAGDLQSQVAEICDPARFAALPITGGDPQRVGEVLAFLAADRDALAPIESLSVPTELAAGFESVLEASASAREALEAAEQAAAAGDLLDAERLVSRHFAHLRSISGRLALMGVSCGDAVAARAVTADLNVALDLHAEQTNVGYGSVWVSQKRGDNVVRVDPSSGEILATIDVGTDPLKLQPADGRMWVRTLGEYVAIDAATNTVVARLPKADVGTLANRNFAIDGAMWICDGHQLHRFDPTSLARVATIDVDVRCDFVYATPDLTLVWTVNEEPGESGESATAVIDPDTNEVVTTLGLPIDVVWPVVFDDSVFFGGQLNTAAVVIDRSTWTVRSTIELPDVVGGGGIATDGISIYVPTRGEQPWNVLVLDAATYEVIDTIEPLDVNGVAVLDGSLWVTNPFQNILQRFDIDR
jgi:DNA-binding beta-propeller fold protein YncE